MLNVLVALALASAGPQESIPPTPAPLKEMAWLVGTWTSDGAGDHRHVIGWIHGKMFLKAEFSLREAGREVYTATSITGYDEAKGKLVASVFASTGAIARSEGGRVRTKDEWVFNGKATVLGKVLHDRVTYRKVDENTFTVAVEIRKDGVWEKHDPVTYRRVK